MTVQADGRTSSKLRIGFIHPDLGIGGAERLVVDAAVALQRRGHEVEVFTSRHDPSRCFAETRDGTLKVRVLGDSFPRSFFNSLHIVFAILRQLALTFRLFFALSPWVPRRFKQGLDVWPFDVFFVDQLSVCVPLVRLFLATRVVFYCHFPDKLLSGGWDVSLPSEGSSGAVPRKKEARGLRSVLKSAYRWPIDTLEEWTTGQADVTLANSVFTSKVYKQASRSLQATPRVVYPGIDLAAYVPLTEAEARSSDVALVKSDRPTLLSLNRFEGKKNVGLAIESFARLTKDGLVDDETFSKLRLVVAGGYDAQTPDNVATLNKLKALCSSSSLSYSVISDLSVEPVSSPSQVTFLLNFSNAQRSALLLAPSTLALLYTPQNEHFGIVPVEAMACGLPVLAANSGGPTETIIDLGVSSGSVRNGTGLLRRPVAQEWAPALAELVMMGREERQHVRDQGRERVQELFDLVGMGRRLEEACLEAKAMGSPGLGGRAMLLAVSLAALAVGVNGLRNLAHSFIMKY